MSKHVVSFKPGGMPTIISHPDDCLRFDCKIASAIESIISRHVYIYLDGQYEIFPNRYRYGTYAVKKLEETSSGR
jgi:hypothetical protein